MIIIIAHRRRVKLTLSLGHLVLIDFVNLQDYLLLRELVLCHALIRQPKVCRCFFLLSEQACKVTIFRCQSSKRLFGPLLVRILNATIHELHPLQSLDHVAEHDRLLALSCLNDVESLGHVEHLHLDQL